MSHTNHFHKVVAVHAAREAVVCAVPCYVSFSWTGAPLRYYGRLVQGPPPPPPHLSPLQVRRHLLSPLRSPLPRWCAHVPAPGRMALWTLRKLLNDRGGGQ